jgi:hypothetical protein
MLSFDHYYDDGRDATIASNPGAAAKISFTKDLAPPQNRQIGVSPPPTGPSQNGHTRARTP